MYLAGNKNKAWRHLLDAGEIGLLNTPANNYVIESGWTWAADNGCFNDRTYVGDDRWFAWLSRQDPENCLFATAPDVVGDHVATVERSAQWLEQIRAAGFPAAFVLQDGATPDTVPWADFDVAFVGGTDSFKLGGADELIAEAQRRGKRVHVGRVNSGKRYERFAALGVESCDGTFLGFGPDANLPHLESWIRKHRQQPALWHPLDPAHLRMETATATERNNHV
jgi:hypothetical protein